MNLLFHELLKRKEYLESLLVRMNAGTRKLPEGRLRVSCQKGTVCYYHIMSSKDTCGKYIPKKEQELACQLAQKDYEQKLYKRAEKELKDIERYLLKYGENNLENIYDGLNEYRKELVTPMVLTDEMFVKQWENEAYETNPYCPEEKVYSTKKDELVRSKSEMLLADMYYELGIPYRYEAQLRLRDGKKKYPDFTILKPKTREIIYHEHFGLMDDEEYRQANFIKLDEYRRNGIYLGKNLIFTYEAKGCYLNIKEIKKMVKEIVLS